MSKLFKLCLISIHFLDNLRLFFQNSYIELTLYNINIDKLLFKLTERFLCFDTLVNKAYTSYQITQKPMRF